MVIEMDQGASTPIRGRGHPSQRQFGGAGPLRAVDEALLAPARQNRPAGNHRARPGGRLAAET